MAARLDLCHDVLLIIRLSELTWSSEQFNESDGPDSAIATRSTRIPVRYLSLPLLFNFGSLRFAWVSLFFSLFSSFFPLPVLW